MTNEYHSRILVVVGLLSVAWGLKSVTQGTFCVKTWGDQLSTFFKFDLKSTVKATEANDKSDERPNKKTETSTKLIMITNKQFFTNTNIFFCGG